MKIKENKKAPSFKLPGTSSIDFDLKDIKGKLLIYFYPKDDTPGCTIETKDFSRLYKKLRKIKCELVGISKDTLVSHEKFRGGSTPLGIRHLHVALAPLGLLRAHRRHAFVTLGQLATQRVDLTHVIQDG